MSQRNKSYSTTEFEHDIRLNLSRNESTCVIQNLQAVFENVESELISIYPSLKSLQSQIGDWLGIDSSRIVVTNGGDDAIDRAIRNALTASRLDVVTHSPSFEMIDIYTHNAGGSVKAENWLDEDFPLESFLRAIDHQAALAVVVSPNNPTGKVISFDHLAKISARCLEQNINLLVDCAYVEFSEADPTQFLADLPNAMVVRTFSKAWGLAGLRVGYLVAPNAQAASELRAIAGPFPVSGLSLNLASNSIMNCTDEMARNVEAIKEFRTRFFDLLLECGSMPIQSQGNFILARFKDADRIWKDLSGEGIGVRKFEKSNLSDCLRITIPPSVSAQFHLLRAFSRIFNRDTELSKFAAVEKTLGADATKIEKPQTSSHRKAQINRKTKETDIQIEINLDGDGTSEISTGIGFLDHMLTALTFHSRVDLKLNCVGDLHIDDHHTAEDCALALGSAISDALGPRKGIKRFGYAYAPLDEALARTVLDFSGRPWPEVHLNLQRELVGTIATENLTHFFQSLAMTMNCSLHVDVIRGTNDHHKSEAAFKSLALALKMAITPSGTKIPSTKGVL